MPKQSRARRRTEMLSRNIEITSMQSTVRLHAVARKGDEPYIDSHPWLELRGTATEPVRGVQDVVISLYPEDTLEVGTARPASVGAIVQIRPDVTVVLRMSHVEFDRVWALALSGHLKYAYIHFTKPHYRTALVVSASFSNVIEE